ncbi:MAG: hypothetical protein LBV44_04945 [Methylobacillus sp.]|jgi:hypothetical protein|nr:hypothetical protein [Methylobacillus sp.]
MKVDDIIGLIGLKSTAPELLQFFAAADLDTPPQLITANQGNQSIKDKQRKLDFQFKFNIINEKFYPPVSPKKDNYRFECYLTQATLFSEDSSKKKKADPKPADFWLGFINPQSSYDQCLAALPGATVSDQTYKGEPLHTIISKKLNGLVELTLWLEPDHSRITTMELSLIEDWELYGHLYFNGGLGAIEQSYIALLVKWLFDRKYLLLPDEAYRETLNFDKAVLLEFSAKYLKNHIWKTQLIDAPFLRYFLSHIRTNKNIEDAQKDMFIDHLYIRAAEKWADYKALNKRDGNYSEATKALNDFKNNFPFLDEAQSKAFMQRLSSLFEDFKQVPIKERYGV